MRAAVKTSFEQVARETAPAAPAIDARAVVKLFGSTPALVRADIAVPAGTVCALVGRNGAGKTTLLRVIATALRPTSGSVLVHGRDVTLEPSAVRHLVELVPATGGAYEDLTAVENLRFAAAMRGVDRRPRHLEEALDRVGLATVAEEIARSFSSGMLRRLALARILLTRPRVVLLDEPYGALDEEGRELVDELLSEIRADGRTALLATHELARADSLADSLHRVEGGVATALPRQRAALGATAAAETHV